MAYQPLDTIDIDVSNTSSYEVPGNCDIIRILPSVNIALYITENPENITDKTGIKILSHKVEYFNVMKNDKIFYIIIKRIEGQPGGHSNITFMKDISFARMKGLLNSVKRAIESADMHGPDRC